MEDRPVETCHRHPHGYMLEGACLVCALEVATMSEQSVDTDHVRERLARTISQAQAPNWWDGDTPIEEGVPHCDDYAAADAVIGAGWTPPNETDVARIVARVEAVLFLACHHCGRLPDEDGDHSCTCPTPDSECLVHTFHPVAPLDHIRAALDPTNPPAGGVR
jgi:hypothetical protein